MSRYANHTNLIGNVKAIDYAQNLMNVLDKYQYGNCCFDVLNLSGVCTSEGILLDETTTEVYIYDLLYDQYDNGCRAAHYIIESNGLIYMEIYAWIDDDGYHKVFDLKKHDKHLTLGFKQFMFQLIKGNYNEK